jgi:hypothetical protein
LDRTCKIYRTIPQKQAKVKEICCVVNISLLTESPTDRLAKRSYTAAAGIFIESANPRKIHTDNCNTKRIFSGKKQYHAHTISMLS